MTVARADLDRLDAWGEQEFERVQQENRIRKLLVVVGSATLADGFAVAV